MEQLFDVFSPAWIGLEKLGATREMVGSRVTCDPAPTDTDEDWLVVLPPGDRGRVSEAVAVLSEGGFEWEGDSEHYQDSASSGFMSWRNGRVNLIVTASADFVGKYRVATSVCKRLNLMSRPDRVLVFRAILYGEAASVA